MNAYEKLAEFELKARENSNLELLQSPKLEMFIRMVKRRTNTGARINIAQSSTLREELNYRHYHDNQPEVHATRIATWLNTCDE